MHHRGSIVPLPIRYLTPAHTHALFRKTFANEISIHCDSWWCCRTPLSSSFSSGHENFCPYSSCVYPDAMMGSAGRGFRGRGGGGFRGRGVVGGRFGGRGSRPEPTGPRDPRSLVSYVDVDAPKVKYTVVQRFSHVCLLWRTATCCQPCFVANQAVVTHCSHRKRWRPREEMGWDETKALVVRTRLC